ncbi:MAG TPA: FAD-dependent oxidoreductase [Acidimicrobiales bacterium]|nr:FAD-dependent oxidoreductase [Acidimicrobiales bacterium]
MADASGTDRPVILAVDDDPAALRQVADQLHGRYGRDYRVVCEPSARRALGHLEAMHEQGARLAVVMCDQWMPEVTGADLLARVHHLYPHTKRALLISWGDWGDEPTAAAVRQAMALGHIDYYLLKPWKSPDELFHRTVGEFLHEWARSDTTAPREVTVVADPWSPRGHELRNLLARNGVPHVFHPSDSAEGARLLREAGREGSTEPIVVLLDGRVLVDPSNADVARGYGVKTELDGPGEFDVVVVGAGPAGLSAAVYASSEGLRALVVERESIGGQAGASSRIRNYLGFSRGVTGAELAQRAYQQAWVFGTSFLLMKDVTGLRLEGDVHLLTISDGTQVRTGTVVLAMGVAYRRLGIPALETLAGAGVFYGASPSEAQQFTGGRVLVVGGGNSAGQAALHLARYAAEVTLVVRGPTLATSMSQYLRDEIDAAENVDVRLSTRVVDGGGDGHLGWLTLRDDQGDTTTPADGLFVLIGAKPNTEWLPPGIARDQYGFVVTGTDLTPTGSAPEWAPERPPFMFETSLPGVFAVGDVRSRSVKRVASAVGEGSVVIQQIHEYLGAVPVTARSPRP